MTITKQLIEEFEGHFRRFLEEDQASKCNNLFGMCVTFEALTATFNKRYAAMVEATRENEAIVESLRQISSK